MTGEEQLAMAEEIMVIHLLKFGDMDDIREFGEVQGINWYEFKKKYSEEITFALLKR